MTLPLDLYTQAAHLRWLWEKAGQPTFTPLQLANLPGSAREYVSLAANLAPRMMDYIDALVAVTAAAEEIERRKP